MAELKFLHGKNVRNISTIKPGAFYLDTAANELWYDDPAGPEGGQHILLFDSYFQDIETIQRFLSLVRGDQNLPDYSLFVDVNNIVVTTLNKELPPASDPSTSATSAKLGIAVLGSMVLGSE